MGQNKININFQSHLCGGKNKKINTNIYFISHLRGGKKRKLKTIFSKPPIWW
ncbi:hypothetical protein [uncultured Gammaproteobacteria bacterium]|nr:hypothetical protein [uncultured Gammaproteobacteria bacterium]VVH59860.1 hypothetical protein BAZOLSSOX_1692 [uncultured Gammaproteobacteria bacterium]